MRYAGKGEPVSERVSRNRVMSGRPVTFADASAEGAWQRLLLTDTVMTTFLRMGLGMTVLVVVYYEIVRVGAATPAAVVAMISLPLWFALHCRILVTQTPIIQSWIQFRAFYQWRLLLTVIGAHATALWLMSVGIDAGGEPWLVATLLLVVATYMGGLHWFDAGCLLLVTNSLAFGWILPEWPLGWIVAWIAMQMIAGLMMRTVIRELLRVVEAQRTLAQLHATRDLLRAQTEYETRHDIARDLHDELGHLTTLACHNLNRYVHQQRTQGSLDPLLAEVHSNLRQLQTEARELSHRLQEESFDLQSALALLQQHVRELSVFVEFVGFDGCCAAAIGKTIFRACQESVTNALRHSTASALNITITRSAAGFQAVIQDNGEGQTEFKAGHGLRGIRQRVEQLGGRYASRGDYGGFRTELIIPLVDSAVNRGEAGVLL